MTPTDIDLTPTLQIMHDCAVRAAYAFDDVLLSALRVKLGADLQRSDVESLRGRLVERKHPDGRSEWLVDGQPYLESWPLRTEMDGSTLRTLRAYRAL
jgi:hypothetical protein